MCFLYQLDYYGTTATAQLMTSATAIITAVDGWLEPTRGTKREAKKYINKHSPSIETKDTHRDDEMIII